MRYTVQLTRSAARELRKVAEPYHKSIVLALRELENEPRPKSCKKLSGTRGFYRIRVGPFRVIYEVADMVKLVSVERIADRKEAYR